MLREFGLRDRNAPRLIVEDDAACRRGPLIDDQNMRLGHAPLLVSFIPVRRFRSNVNAFGFIDPEL